MKKIIILLVLILSSCGIEYDGETKLVVKGIVVDENNNPLPNKEVTLFVTNDGQSFVYNETNYIGRAITNNQGNYTLVFPEPKNFTEMYVNVNSLDISHNKKQYRNIQMSNFHNYQFNLPTTVLYNKANLATLQIILNQINQNIDLRKIEIIGNVANEIEYFNTNESLNFYYELEHLVKKNQIITIKYSLYNYTTNSLSTIEENIVIDNSNQINYTLNY
jgi:hypothetical protein